MRRTLAVALSAGLAAAVAAGPVATASAAPVRHAALVRHAAPVRSATASGPQFVGHEVFVIIALKVGSKHPKVVAKGTFHAVGHLDFGRRVGIIVFKHGQITITHHVISNSGSVPTPPSCRFTITQRGTFAITKGTKRYTGLRGSGDYQTTIHGRLGHTSNGLCTSKIVSYRSVTYDRGFVR
jgi:hypothetical protein